MTLALFDFDGTITTADTFTPFLRLATGLARLVVGGLLVSPFVVAHRLRLLSAVQTRPMVACAVFQGDCVVVVSAYRRGDCSGPVKAALVRATIDLSRVETVYAYGDTVEDREMLALAHRKFCRWNEIDRFPWLLETVELSAPDVPKSLVLRQTTVRANVRGEPTAPYVKELFVSREYDAGMRDETYQLGTIGGTVPGVTPTGAPAGPREHHAIGWDEGALVLRRGSYTGDRPETGIWTERRETWSIDAADRLHIVVVTRSSAEVPRTRHVIYRRP